MFLDYSYWLMWMLHIDIPMQVSHHPPMSAGHAENEHFTYDVTSKLKTKFLGNSVDVYPVGRSVMFICYSWIITIGNMFLEFDRQLVILLAMWMATCIYLFMTFLLYTPLLFVNIWWLTVLTFQGCPRINFRWITSAKRETYFFTFYTLHLKRFVFKDNSSLFGIFHV